MLCWAISSIYRFWGAGLWQLSRSPQKCHCGYPKKAACWMAVLALGDEKFRAQKVENERLCEFSRGKRLLFQC
jgi:hypothetical protein